MPRVHPGIGATADNAGSAAVGIGVGSDALVVCLEAIRRKICSSVHCVNEHSSTAKLQAPHTIPFVKSGTATKQDTLRIASVW